jgi:hypothetical protein
VFEEIGPGSFERFERAVLFATSDRYRDEVKAQIEAELAQGIGICWECPIGHRHPDGVCIEQDCDCPTRDER